eukprot:scaffold96545_cov72-Phaeocystis_antarctica.AAC.1
MAQSGPMVQSCQELPGRPNYAAAAGPGVAPAHALDSAVLSSSVTTLHAHHILKRILVSTRHARHTRHTPTRSDTLDTPTLDTIDTLTQHTHINCRIRPPTRARHS